MGGGKVIVVKSKQEWDEHMANSETTYIVVGLAALRPSSCLAALLACCFAASLGCPARTRAASAASSGFKFVALSATLVSPPITRDQGPVAGSPTLVPGAATRCSHFNG
jgi:hypothetical protein